MRHKRKELAKFYKAHIAEMRDRLNELAVISKNSALEYLACGIGWLPENDERKIIYMKLFEAIDMALKSRQALLERAINNVVKY